MTPQSPRQSALAVLRGGIALLLAGPAGLSAAEWQSLLSNTPFGQATTAQAAAAGDLEFRGVVQEEGVYLVNLFDPATKSSQWVPVGGKTSGLEVRSYDATSFRVQIMQAGRPLSLSLKQSRIALTGNATTVELPESPAGADGVLLPEFMRNLPPEARKMLEDVRRRRAIRSPFPSGDPALAGTGPAAAPRPARPNSP